MKHNVARAFLKNHFVVDAHADTWGRIAGSPSRFYRQNDRLHLDFPRMKKNGLNLQFAAIYTPDSHAGESATSHAMELLGTIRQCVHDGPLMCIRTVRDLDKLKRNNRHGVILLLEGGSPFQGNLAVLDAFFSAGVRVIGLTHNARNALACGVAGKGGKRGLTDFGNKVIHRAGTLGMLIDLSHLALPGVRDVFKITSGPVCATHAGARWLLNHPRNLDRATVQEIAKRGGCIGVYYVSDFLARAKASVHTVADHIEAMLEVAGEDHVGLGSDFDGFEDTPAGMEGLEDLPNLVSIMSERGYTKNLMKKILGDNWYRLLCRTLPT